MKMVIWAGTDEESRHYVEERFRGQVRMLGAATGRETLERLEKETADLLILESRVQEPAAPDVLQRARSLPAGANLRVLYLQEGPAFKHEVLGNLKRGQLMVYPLDLQELVREVALALHLDVPEPGARPESAEVAQSADASLLKAWERFHTTNLERLHVLEQAVVCMARGSLVEEHARRASTEAHRLVGSLGTFGLTRGATLARELEQGLGDGVAVGQAGLLAQALVGLRQELGRGPSQTLAAAPRLQQAMRGGGQRILMVDDDRELSDQICLEAAERGLLVEVAESLETARTSLALRRPDLVLMNLDLKGNSLELLREIQGMRPFVPVVALASQGNFALRLQAGELGATEFVEKTRSPLPILERVQRTLSLARSRGGRVLVVDDDPIIRAAVSGILEEEGFTVVAIGDPEKFWDTLHETNPDLLVLDLEMPRVHGTELCRVVRNDTRWCSLPILVLTAHGDANTVARVYASGADDFVTKPVQAVELTARVTNRLYRTHELRLQGDLDPLTDCLGRKRLLEHLTVLTDAGRRHQLTLCLAMCRVDKRGQATHEHGLAAGDGLLRRLSRRCREHLRRGTDLIGRWEEDVLALAIFGQTREQGLERLQMIHDAFARARSADEGPDELASMTAVVASFPADSPELPGLLARLDYAMRISPLNRVNTTTMPELGQPDVVIVEDDASLAVPLVEHLEARGYKVRWMSDGESAAQSLLGPAPQVSPPVILLDLELPLLDGMSLLEKMQSEGRLGTSRVIILSSRSAPTDVVRAQELGAFDYVTKPFALPLLTSRIRRAIGVAS